MKPIWVILLVIGAIAGTFILVKTFGPSQTEDSKWRDKAFELMEEKAQMERERRLESDSVFNVRLAEAKRQDTIYINNSKQNAQKIANVDRRVNDIPDNELTRAINARYPD